jgi:RNA polymerase sigma-70 factor (ECF subfamily)
MSAPSDIIDELAYKALILGEPDAWRELFDRHSPQLFKGIRRRVPNDAAAEDLLQETWLNILNGDYDPGRLFIPWAIRIARNRCTDWLRKGKPAVSLGEIDLLYHGLEPLDSVISREEIEQLNACLSHLDDKERFILVAKYRDGLSNETIAEKAGINSEGVRARCYRLIHKLKKCMGLGTDSKKEHG